MRLTFQGDFEWQRFHCDTLGMILQRSYGPSNGFLAEGILSHTPDPHHTVMVSTHTQQNRNKNNGPTPLKNINTHQDHISHIASMWCRLPTIPSSLPDGRLHEKTFRLVAAFRGTTASFGRSESAIISFRRHLTQ